MIAYAALMVIFFGMGAFYRTRFDDKKRTTKYMITTFFVVYLFLLCFRATSVGIDTINYVNRYFYPFHTMSWREVFMFSSDEPGFSSGCLTPRRSSTRSSLPVSSEPCCWSSIPPASGRWEAASCKDTEGYLLSEGS